MTDFGIFSHFSQTSQGLSLPVKVRTTDAKPGRYSLKGQVLSVALDVPEEDGSP